MRILLDTHALLWALQDSPRLSRKAAELIESTDVVTVISAVSAYEICLTFTLGKLPSASALAENFASAISGMECVILPVTLDHAALAGSLPTTHKDPFDRLLIAQARAENLVLISNEAIFDGFGVARIW